MGRLSWIIQVSPKSNHTNRSKRKVERDLTTAVGDVTAKVMIVMIQGRLHEPRNSGGPQKLEESKKEIFL